MWFELDELSRQLGWVDLPEGCYPVKKGAIKPGDLYLDRLAFKAGYVWWESALGQPQHGHTQAQYYSLLIRKGVQPDAHICPCWRERKRNGCKGRLPLGQLICDECVAWRRGNGWSVVGRPPGE